MSGQFGLLRTPPLCAAFFGTQFLGAFNDNLFKNALVVLLTFQSAQWTTLAPELLANLAAGIFILPFFLFSATAGQLADKYDKALLARLVKLLEMAIMGVAAAGFWLHSLPVLMGRCFCSAARRRCSGRSSTPSCRSICTRMNWSAAMR
jgi:MFS family permease